MGGSSEVKVVVVVVVFVVFVAWRNIEMNRSLYRSGIYRGINGGGEGKCIYKLTLTKSITRLNTSSFLIVGIVSSIRRGRACACACAQFQFIE